MATIGTPSLLDCPVCCDKYKNPKMISCGHTFCLDPCLRNLVQSSSPNCPLCRIPIQKPPSGKVEDVPTNFVLQSLLEEQTENIETSAVVQKRNGPMLQKKCSSHEKDLVYYCTVCSELLCQNCLDEIHNKDHETLEVHEAVNEYCGMLVPVEKDLMDVTKKSNDVCSFLEDAKTKFKLDGDNTREKINEAGDSLIMQVKNKMAELHSELDKKETNELKSFENLKAKAAEISLLCECIHDMCRKMKLELSQLNFRNKTSINSVMKKASELLQDVCDLENEAFKDHVSIVFQPIEQRTPLPLGVLKDQSPEGKKLCLSVSKLRELKCYPPKDYSYTSYTLLSANAILFLFQRSASQNSFLKPLYRTGQTEQSLTDVCIEGDIRFASSIQINKQSKLLFVKNSHTPLEVIFNESCKTFSVNSSSSVSNALLYQISALSWGERGEVCYALLSDGETIKSFTFTPEKRETFHVKLDQKVNCLCLRGFHVSEFGMAICSGKCVLFYESTKSRSATRIIRAPADVSDFQPVCVMSHQKNKKWYVQWQNFGGKSCRVCQYSLSFEEELLLPELWGGFISFSFLGEKYISTDTYRYSCTPCLPHQLSISVFEIKRSL